MINSKVSKIKHIYYSLIKVNHLLFCISYLLFKATIEDSLVGFYLKRHYYRSEFFSVCNTLPYNVCLYLRLFQIPTNLKLEIYSLMKVALKVLIFLRVFKSTLYKIKRQK